MTTATLLSPTRPAIAAQTPTDDAHLTAYNAAFSDLGLRFRWDHATLDAFAGIGNEIARITAYIDRFHAHLHKAYEADFLAELIFSRKTQFYREYTPRAAD